MHFLFARAKLDRKYLCSFAHLFASQSWQTYRRTGKPDELHLFAVCRETVSHSTQPKLRSKIEISNEAKASTSLFMTVGGSSHDGTGELYSGCVACAARFGLAMATSFSPHSHSQQQRRRQMAKTTMLTLSHCLRFYRTSKAYLAGKRALARFETHHMSRDDRAHVL